MDLDATHRFLAANGERVRLRRYTARAVFTEVDCAARVTNYAADDAPSGVVQGDRLVIISNVEIAAANWPGPPVSGDTLILLSHGGVTATVRGVEPTVLRGTTCRYTLTIRGT